MSTSEDDGIMVWRYSQRGQTDMGWTLVEGCKLGGRAKTIFVDVVKEDMKFVGTGGQIEAADWS